MFLSHGPPLVSSSRHGCYVFVIEDGDDEIYLEHMRTIFCLIH
jgi:hypothetical protein